MLLAHEMAKRVGHKISQNRIQYFRKRLSYFPKVLHFFANINKIYIHILFTKDPEL